MKRLYEKLITVFIFSIIIVTVIICFAACDDNTYDNDGNSENKQLIFAEGTTIDDVLEMFNQGIVESCTMQEYENGVLDTIYKCNGEIWFNSSFEEWSIYAVDEHKFYGITDIDGEIKYEWLPMDSDTNAVDNMKENMLNILQFDNFKDISVNANSVNITIESSHGDTYEYIWTDFNNTYLSIPQEYSNYKELATEGIWAN